MHANFNISEMYNYKQQKKNSVINTLTLDILAYAMCAIHLIYHVAETFVRQIYVLELITFMYTVTERSQLSVSNE